MAGHYRNTSNFSLANDSLAFAEEAEMPVVKMFKLTFEVLVALFGAIGNFLVVVVISRLGKKKQPTNFYVLNLAIADLGILTLHFLLGLSRKKRLSTGLLGSSLAATYMLFLKYSTVRQFGSLKSSLLRDIPK